MGLRLQLRKAQAEAGDIILLYGDESEALTHPYLARAWACRCGRAVPGRSDQVAIIGSLDHVTRQLIVHTSQTNAAATSSLTSSNSTTCWVLNQDGQ